MSTQVAVREEVCFDAMLSDITKMQALSTKLMQTKHYQTLGEAGIFAVVQKAKTLDMNPLDALNGALYYLQGKVGMPAETMNAMIRTKGHSITKDPKSNDTICILHGRRCDTGDTWVSSFSIEDAKRAGLMKNMYEKYTQGMLYNRAMSFLARQLFPDVIKGAGYTHEELKEIASNKPVYEEKIHEVKFEEVVNLIGNEKLKILQEMIGTDEELKRLILSGFRIDSLEKILDKDADAVIRRVTQILQKREKQSQELVEENRKVMEA